MNAWSDASSDVVGLLVGRRVSNPTVSTVLSAATSPQIRAAPRVPCHEPLAWNPDPDKEANPQCGGMEPAAKHKA